MGWLVMTDGSVGGSNLRRVGSTAIPLRRPIRAARCADGGRVGRERRPGARSGEEDEL